MRDLTLLSALALGVACSPLQAEQGGWLTGTPEPPPSVAAPTEPRPAPPALEDRPEVAVARERAPAQRCEGMKPAALRERPLPRGTNQLTGVTPSRIKQVPEAHAWHEKALAALESGSLVQVVVAVRKAYQAGLSQSESDRILGLALLKAENHADGLLHMRRALEAPEERRPANFRALGQLHVLSGDPARAIRAFESALELDPDDGDTHLLLAVTYDTVGHSPKVLEHAQKAIRIDPEYKEKLKPFIRNSNVSKRIGCVVSSVLKDSKDHRLTDRAIERYAEELGRILGEARKRQAKTSSAPRPGPFAPTR